MKIKLSDERLGPLPDDQLDRLSRRDLLCLLRTEHRLRVHLEGYVSQLEDKVFELDGLYFRIKSKLFGRSSEKSKPPERRPRSGGSRKSRKTSPRLPSERYPDAEIIDKHITCEVIPSCRACGNQMVDSGLTETSEYLTVIPKQYLIVRQHRHKYRCSCCHGDIVTTPPIPRVIPGSAYSDELIIDAALSKYCDLIPMERYTEMARRGGFAGLPPQSLIAAVIRLAEYLMVCYFRLRTEVLGQRVLLADETPHRMLEGDERRGWYLWGFLSDDSCFYECHDTRSGEVASKILIDSSCEVLLTDVYSGYKRAVREANDVRNQQQVTKALIKVAYCNAHARRGFKNGNDVVAVDAKHMVDSYREIYKLEASAKGLGADTILAKRQEMRPYFESMRTHAERHAAEYSEKSTLGKAFNYFLENYTGLTCFLTDPEVPIDNNASERILRPHVLGRKTWYGTHSIESAKAAAIHFSLIQSCKLIGLNPRTYYRESVARIQAKKMPLTPKEMAAELTDFATRDSS